jgi:hypothetical protein
MIILEGYDLKKLKEIFEMVEYDIEMLEEEGGDFLGLAIGLSGSDLIFVFMSDSDEFDADIMPWTIWLDGDFGYKTGYIEDYAVRELIQLFKENDPDSLKVILDEELNSLKVVKNDETVFDYTIY